MKRCAATMFYVNQRWLGGLLTNFQTIQKSIKRLKEIEAMQADGRYRAVRQEGAARRSSASARRSRRTSRASRI